MLIEAGLLNQDQLKQAIVDHKRTNMKLGQYLVREGFVSGSQVADIISKQLKIKKYIPDNYPIDIDLSKALPLELAQKYQAARIGTAPNHRPESTIPSLRHNPDWVGSRPE